MAFVTPYQEGDAPDLEYEGALGGLGAAYKDVDKSAVPPLATSHTELSRLQWLRGLVAKALAGKPYRVRVTDDDVLVELLEPLDRTIVPWSKSAQDLARASLFSTNSKMRCVAAGTPIITNRGVIPIEEVRVGDTVLTREGFKAVTAAQQTGLRATMKIVSDMGHEVRVTPDHLILAKASWPLGENPSPSARGELSWFRADALQLGMFVCPAPENFDAALASVPDDWELGVLLGYVCGDGTFAANGRIAIDVGEAKRADLSKLADIALRRFGAEPHWGEYAGRRGTTTPDSLVETPDEESESITRLYWEHAPLSAFFHEHGFSHGVYSPLRRVPPQVRAGSRDIMQGFLSGLMSTDGSILIAASGRVQAELDSTSKQLLLDVQQLCAVLGARTGITQRKHVVNGRQFRDIFRLQLNSAAVLNVLRESRLFNELKAQRLGPVQAQKTSQRVTRIAAIEADGLVMPVYDLSVEGLPEFTAGGLIVHNCPTFDLPSGVASLGGSCPGAYWSQTVVPKAVLDKIADEKRWAERKVLKRTIDPQTAVCQNCYASGGSYGYTSTQFRELLIYGFVRSSMDAHIDSDGVSPRERLVRLFVHAITKTLVWSKQDASLTLGGSRIKPIRVHSSGDFFSTAYIDFWMEVARRVQDIDPDIIFWAPTRTHVLENFSKHWKSITIPSNFIIRASGYHLGDPAPAPVNTGNAKGSSVLTESEVEQRLRPTASYANRLDGVKADHQCGVYALGPGAKSCSFAQGPNNSDGCRACWTHPHLRINYAAH